MSTVAPPPPPEADPQVPAVFNDIPTTRKTAFATNLWRAWVGFNLSHSVGAMLFGALAIAWPALSAGSDALAWVPAGVAAVYLAIGLRFWFSVPNAGIALATLAFVAAAMAA